MNSVSVSLPLGKAPFKRGDQFVSPSRNLVLHREYFLALPSLFQFKRLNSDLCASFCASRVSASLAIPAQRLDGFLGVPQGPFGGKYLVVCPLF